MGFVSPSSKLERAVKAFLMLQGKAAVLIDPTKPVAEDGNTFISNDGRVRSFPNRSILATGFSPTSSKRPDGRVYFGVQHHFAAPGAGSTTGRAAMDLFVGASADSLMVSDGDSMQVVADGITAAGRWLAQTDNTPEGDAIAADNADMVNFRCDWIKLADPFLVRGKADSGSTDGDWAESKGHWVEILNFIAFVSQAGN
jgi:hypothetical protein